MLSYRQTLTENVMKQNNLQNKIDATDIDINSLLKDEKFFIDYFQREYRWQEKHIKLLVDDLSSAFLKSYDPEHERKEVANYQTYYLGPVVFSENTDNGKKSIIDGQQRITSITLLLIFLNHLQSALSSKVSISNLIFSEQYGEKSFNMTDEDREPCLKALFENGSYELSKKDDETIKNMIERYGDIEEVFPEEIDEKAIPYFIDWFIKKVIIVKITAYSDENAYTIFETMNDRGLSLTPSEMLKGYVLSRITDKKQRTEINEIWKEEIQKLHKYGDTADQAFFQAWFRGKYAETIRPGKVGSENKDFEIIGTRFHNWFKDNHEKYFHLKTPDDFYQFFQHELPFFVDWYIEIKNAQNTFRDELAFLNYVNYWGIADSLQDPLLLSSITFEDKCKPEIIKNKLNLTARYIETFTIRRSVNYKKFSQTSIKYTMFGIIKLIRNNDIITLGKNLKEEVSKIEQKWDGIEDFRLHGQNKKFIKHLLSRISSYIDNLTGKTTNYVSYHHPKGKQFEIEHIWSDKFEEYKDEFEQTEDFQRWRNSIGALILLPNGTNQSYKDASYEEKLSHYIKENTFAQSLNKLFYAKNPNFLNSIKIQELGFKPHKTFKKNDIVERTELVKKICENIWNTDNFEKNI